MFEMASKVDCAGSEKRN